MRRLRRLILMACLTIGLTAGACAKDSLRPYTTNRSPVMNSLTIFPTDIGAADSATITCLASDQDGDTLVYDWDTDLRLRIKGNAPGDPTKSNTLSNMETFYPSFNPTRLETVWVATSVRDRRGGSAVRIITFTIHP